MSRILVVALILGLCSGCIAPWDWPGHGGPHGGGGPHGWDGPHFKDDWRDGPRH